MAPRINRKWIAGFLLVKVLEVFVLCLLFAPASWAADGEAAVGGDHPMTEEEILAYIQSTDPTLYAEMQAEGLSLGEVGIDLASPDLGLSAELGSDRSWLGDPTVGGTGQGLPGRVVDLPPEVQAELKAVFDAKGTGDPRADHELLRDDVAKILEKHGIDPTVWDHEFVEGDWGEGHEGRWQDILPPPGSDTLPMPVFDGSETGEHSYVGGDHSGFSGPEGSWDSPTFGGSEVDYNPVDVPMTEQSGYEAPTTVESSDEAPTAYEPPSYEAPLTEYTLPEYQSEPSQYEGMH